MAEIFYGVPEDLWQEFVIRIPPEMNTVLERFDTYRIQKRDRMGDSKR